jgi:hypothetical protein
VLVAARFGVEQEQGQITGHLWLDCESLKAKGLQSCSELLRSGLRGLCVHHYTVTLRQTIPDTGSFGSANVFEQLRAMCYAELEGNAEYDTFAEDLQKVVTHLNLQNFALVDSRWEAARSRVPSENTDPKA